MKNEACFNLRLPEELNEKIRLIAIEENRSKNQQIEYILKEYVKKYEDKNQKINISQKYNENATINFNDKIT